MFAKILHGQFELKQMFWKYGVWGLFIQTFILYLFRIFLIHKLNGLTLSQYYKTVFTFINMDNMMLFLTITYLTLLAFLTFYSIILIMGIWRSSNEYDKSIWLRHIARLFTLVIVFLAFKVVL
ncbi:MAG: hypothetical protein J6X42_00185 [Alphaproteobacteria bacterium]|nr:hypothetical protein [Alphaproteobacteria bacterium]